MSKTPPYNEPLYDGQNVFAKILRGEIPCVKVYEDEQTLAFMDVMPQADGHVLVIPKSPAVNLFDLDAQMALAVMQTTQKLARAVKKAMQCGGVMIAQLNGAPAGQTVFHIHIHIIPRENGVEMNLHAKDMVDADILERHAVKIRATL